MRHHSNKRIFGRKRGQRIALLRTLAVSLVTRDAIKTTEAKAKELRPFIEKMVTKSRADGLAARRLLISKLGGNNNRAVRKLMSEIGPKYKTRAGGYTRIIKLGSSSKGGAPMARIEFV